MLDNVLCVPFSFSFRDYSHFDLRSVEAEYNQQHYWHKPISMNRYTLKPVNERFANTVFYDINFSVKSFPRAAFKSICLYLWAKKWMFNKYLLQLIERWATQWNIINLVERCFLCLHMFGFSPSKKINKLNAHPSSKWIFVLSNSVDCLNCFHLLYYIG